MTLEQKAKRYDEISKEVKDFFNGKQKMYTDVTKTLEFLFPELRESEDERIRGAIIDHLKDNNLTEWAAWLEKQGKETNWKPTEEQYEALDYAFYNIPDNKKGNYYAGVLENLIEDLHRLEKQDGEKPVIEMKSAEESLGISSEKYNDIVNECLYGESNSSDKVKPMFKVGDWVIRSIKNEKRIGTVTEILPEHYIINFDGWREQIPIIYGDCIDIRLWTIQDAKDGDVLAVNGKPFICYHTDEYKGNYCCIDDKGCFRTNIRFSFEGNCILPATKEQRDTLLKAMADAGYTFDFDKKELKKIPNALEECEIEHIEHGKYYYCIKDYYSGGNKRASKGEVIQALRGMSMMALGVKANEYFIPVKCIVDDRCAWSEKDEKMFRSLHNLIYVVRDCDCDSRKKKEYSDWVESLKGRYQPKQEQEWSKEDEKCIRLSTNIIDSALRAGFCVQLDRDRCVDWLESLKDRVLPQPKQEWSEEDIHNRENIDSVLFYEKDLPEETCMRLRNWLKSLKPNKDMVEALRTEYEKGRADVITEMKSSWSEEDETRIKNILSVLDAQVCWDGATGKKGNPYQKDIDWLKSLKDRYTWRPSEEQIEVLEDTIKAYNEVSFPTEFRVLSSLCDDLKKLMEK